MLVFNIVPASLFSFALFVFAATAMSERARAPVANPIGAVVATTVGCLIVLLSARSRTYLFSASGVVRRTRFFGVPVSTRKISAGEVRDLHLTSHRGMLTGPCYYLELAITSSRTDSLACDDDEAKVEHLATVIRSILQLPPSSPSSKG